MGVGSMVSKFYFIVNWSLLELFAKKKLLFCLITELSRKKFYDTKKLHVLTKQMIKISENLLLICVSQFRWRGLLIAATYKRFVVFFYWYLFKLIIETRGKINTIWTIYRSVVFFSQQPLAKIPFQKIKFHVNLIKFCFLCQTINKQLSWSWLYKRCFWFKVRSFKVNVQNIPYLRQEY